jgi:hypothetical protein
MSDTERDAALAILAEELSIVTPAMIEAGSVALTEMSTLPGGSGLATRETSEAQRLAAVWRAMLAVKLAGHG